MTRKIRIGDWVIVPSINYEVQVAGIDGGTDELIIRYVLDNGRDAFKTVSRKSAMLYVD